jgi:hypothetical protein
MKIAFFIIIFALLFSASIGSAGVVVFDDIIPVHNPFKLKALTKGRFFPDGGRLVTFYVEQQKIGTTLSGGDGYAFLKYTPAAPGILKVKVEAGGETDEGVILAVGKKDKVIIIEIESALLDSVISLKPAKDSNESLQQLAKNFRVLYLTTLIGNSPSRTWLKEYSFPAGPVFKWDSAYLLDELQVRGIKVSAIIASPSILSEAQGIAERFSFHETEDGEVVTDWHDLVEQLLPQKKK